MNIIFIAITIIIFILAPVSAYAATLTLSPATGTFNKNCKLSLKVDLDTGASQTDGADAIIKYDASRFTVTSITPGTVYPDYPGNNIDAANGKITISGLASFSQPFTGQGSLATINLTVAENAPTGITAIKFDFDPNDKAKTTDSNVVERSTIVDVLNSVVDGNYTIGTGACSGTVLTGGKGGTGTIATSSGVPIQKTLPDRGTETLTYTVAILGSVLTILGILGLALL